MAAIIQGSQEMNAFWPDANPGVSMIKKSSPNGMIPGMVCHLTANRSEIVNNLPKGIDPDVFRAKAITITAKVGVTAASRAEIDAEWEFHLMQFYHVDTDYAYYAALFPSGGSLKLDFANPPALPGSYLLDTLPAVYPTVDLAKDVIGLPSGGTWQVVVTTHDHPFSVTPLMTANSRAAVKDSDGGTTAVNYLYEVRKEHYLATIFVAKHKATNKITQLGRIHWGVVWSVRLSWRDADGSTDVDSNTGGSQMFATEMMKGVADADLTAMINTPPPITDSYNVQSKKALESVYTQHAVNNRPSERWTLDVPASRLKIVTSGAAGTK